MTQITIVVGLAGSLAECCSAKAYFVECYNPGAIPKKGLVVICCFYDGIWKDSNQIAER